MGTLSERDRTIRELAPDRCLVIGEVAQAHDGSLGLAHAFIDAIAAAGADAVKFQTHVASAESTPSEPWRVRFSLQDATRYDYWRRMEFSEEQWGGLRQHADERALHFLSSPFSLEAADLLSRVGVAAWKVASGELTNSSLLDRLAGDQILVLLSTGMSSWEDVDRAVARVRAAEAPIAVLQCTTAYPCPPGRVGLNLLAEFRQRYGCPVGLSDHSGTIFPGLAAVALGCQVLEVHVTLSREMFGPDVAASVTVSELRQLVEGIRFIEAMRRSPVAKDVLAKELAPMRALFTRSLVARRALAAGHILAPADLVAKKPGTGIPPERLKEVVGRRLRRPLVLDQLLHHDDLEE